MTDQETQAVAAEDGSAVTLNDASQARSLDADGDRVAREPSAGDEPRGSTPAGPGGIDNDVDADAEADHADEADDAGTDEDTVEVAAAGGRSARRLSKERAAALEREGEVAADFLERLLDIADLDGDIDVDVDGDRAAVAIVDSEDGRVPRRLVGTDGKVLEALQELTRLAVQASTGDRSRLMLDVAGHRAGRREAVLDETRAAIAEVRDGAEKVALTPMSAFERKVAHDAILAAGLVSESDGVEPRRFVVVYPR